MGPGLKKPSFVLKNLKNIFSSGRDAERNATQTSVNLDLGQRNTTQTSVASVFQNLKSILLLEGEGQKNASESSVLQRHR